MDNLKQQISLYLDNMGGTVLGQACVDSFFSLKGAQCWKPEKVLLNEISYVIDIGLVLSIVGIECLPGDYQDKINEAVKSGANIEPDLWSEILVATLLKRYGASVNFIPRGQSKTSDLKVFWEPSEPVDIEVTRAKTRLLHDAVKKGVKDFIQALRPGDVDWHFLCFVSDASKPEILAAAFDSAVKLVPGQQAEEEGLWSVEAFSLSERDKIVGGQNAELVEPSWWPHGDPVFFSTGTLLNNKGNPVVMLRSLVPHTSYINPIERKANHCQHTEGVPYIIALNASDLPNAHERLQQYIEENFPIWKHVSGVLIFNPLFYIKSGMKALQFRLFSNPNSDYPMPNQLSCLSKDLKHILEFVICLK